MRKLLEQVALDAGQMEPHGTACLIGGALPQRSQNRAMMRNRVTAFVDRDGCDPHRAPSWLGTRGVEGTNEGDKYLVMGGFRDGEVKSAVPLHPTIVVEHFGRSAHADFDSVQIRLSCFRCSQGRDCRFDSEPGLHGIARTGQGKTAIDSGGRRRGSAPQYGAITSASPKLSLQFHLRQTLAKRPAANPEFGGQFSFRRKTVTFLQPVLLDVGQHRVHSSASLRSCRFSPRSLLAQPQRADKSRRFISLRA